MAAKDRRLDALRRAHEPPGKGSLSPRVEDYVEVVYELLRTRGEARIVDIGAHLHVASPTVTKMIQRLDDEGLVVYRRYRGVALTERGERLAEELRHRHGVVSDLLKILGVDDATAHRDTEGIEHHLDPTTLRRIADLVEHAQANPDWWDEFRAAKKRR